MDGCRRCTRDSQWVLTSKVAARTPRKATSPEICFPGCAAADGLSIFSVCAPAIARENFSFAALFNHFMGIETFAVPPVRVTFDSTISAVEPVNQSGGLYLSPGFIDLQVNGFLGVDFNNPKCTLEQIARSIRGLFATGVTRFYPTVITGSPADMLGALRNLRCAKETLREGAAIDGFHVEGPHISPDDGPRGAHPRRWGRPPDLDRKSVVEGKSVD